jgi:ribosomal-protein-alanine N-acetyltransferase
VGPPTLKDADEFLDAVAASRDLHRPWVFPPDTPDAFAAYIERGRHDDHRGFFVRTVGGDGGGMLVGVVNLNHVMRGNVQSAALGYYAFAAGAGRGLMRAGLSLVVTAAFERIGLHRLEANIQPGNVASIRLVASLGFRCEGVSPQYLRVGGEWKDHERWAILDDKWRDGRPDERHP